MENDGLWGFLLGAIVGTAMTFVITFNLCENSYRKKAVDNGSAKWTVDKYGKLEFIWKSEWSKKKKK